MCLRCAKQASLFSQLRATAKYQEASNSSTSGRGPGAVSTLNGACRRANRWSLTKSSKDTDGSTISVGSKARSLSSDALQPGIDLKSRRAQVRTRPGHNSCCKLEAELSYMSNAAACNISVLGSLQCVKLSTSDSSAIALRKGYNVTT